MSKATKATKAKDRCILDYMSRENGRGISASQTVGAKKWNVLSEKINRARQAMQVLKDCGLDKEAHNMIDDINKLEHERVLLEERLNNERIEMGKAILLSLASCDIATVCADEFADTMHRLSYGVYDKDNALSQAVREQADSFNKIVTTIDKADHTAMSMYYSDMAQEVTDRVIPIIKEIINKYCNTHKGRMLF